MRLSPEEHLEHSWLVSRLASDFELLDVWRYPIELDEHVPFERFVDFMQSSQRDLASSRSAAGALFRLRAVLGKIFGWDDERKPSAVRAIPGCTETSLRDRLTQAERESEEGPSPLESTGTSGLEFKPVYQRDNEILLEISNNTVHALMHLGRVSVSATHWSPQLGVYVKPRGSLGRFYMALISPFRHYIVYPAMMRMARKNWARQSTRPPS